MLRLIILSIFIVQSANIFAKYSVDNDSIGIEIRKEADQLYDDGKFSRAIEKYKLSAHIFEKEENWKFNIEDKISILECYFYLGNSEEIYNLINQVKEECKLYLGDQHLLMGEFFYLLAKIDHRFNNAEKVPEYATNALDILKKDKGDNRRTIAGCYNIIAIYWMSKKDYEQALNYYDQALKLKIDALGKNDRSVGVTLNNIGVVYYYLGNNSKAISYYESALDIKIEELGSQHPRVADTYFNIASVYAKDDNYKKAIDLFKKALKINQVNEEDQNRKLAHILTSLSEAYFHENQFELAIKYGNQAIEYYNRSKENPIYSATAYQNMGTIYQSVEKYDLALPFYQKALELLTPYSLEESIYGNPIIEKYNTSERLYQVLYEKLLTLEAWNNELPQESIEQAALNTSEALIQTILYTQLDIESENSKFLFLQDSRLIFEKALSFCLSLWERTGDPMYKEKALGIYEQSRAFLLRNILQNERAQTLAEIPDSISQKVLTIKEELNEIVFQIKETADSVKINELKNLLFERNRTYQSLVTQLEQNFPKYYQMKNNLIDFKLSDIQENINDEEAVITWFVGKTQLFFFEITNTQITFKKLEIDSTLDEAVTTFSSMLNDNVLASKKGNSKQLYQDFIQQSRFIFKSIFPAEISFPQSVILIPDGILSVIPLEILLTKETIYKEDIDYSSLPYILKSANVRYAYSPSFVLDEMTTAKKRKNEVLAFAPSYTNNNTSNLATRSEFSTLEFAQKEIKKIDKIITTNALFGSSATKENFKNLSHDYRFLHLAMHAIADDQSPAFSGLVFPGHENRQSPEVLYAYEIANMELSSDLVVLSACNTGSGKQVAGEGPISLARSFRQAGCPNIVRSLWQADDETTSILMEKFYENLKSGKGKAEALKLAKLSYLEQSRKNFPHYWATFVLTGDDEPIDFDQSYRFWYIIFFGALFLVGAYYWKRRLA